MPLQHCRAVSGRCDGAVGLTVIRDRNGVTCAWCVQPVWTRCQREPSLIESSQLSLCNCYRGRGRAVSSGVMRELCGVVR
jgi:hypothetical protein